MTFWTADELANSELANWTKALMKEDSTLDPNFWVNFSTLLWAFLTWANELPLINPPNNSKHSFKASMASVPSWTLCKNCWWFKALWLVWSVTYY